MLVYSCLLRVLSAVLNLLDFLNDDSPAKDDTSELAQLLQNKNFSFPEFSKLKLI